MIKGSGKNYAGKFIDLYGIEIKDKDGNRNEDATNNLKESLGKTYDVLFDYLCDKITEGAITSPSSVNGAHTGGAYSGVTTGKVKIKLT